MPRRQRLQLKGLYIPQESAQTASLKKKKKGKKKKISKGGLQVVLAGGSDHSLKEPEKFPLFFTVVRFVSRQKPCSTTQALQLLSSVYTAWLLCSSLSKLLTILTTQRHTEDKSGTRLQGCH